MHYVQDQIRPGSKPPTKHRSCRSQNSNFQSGYQHSKSMTDWTCKCTAINQPQRRSCWRCSLTKPEINTTDIDVNANAELSIRDLFLPYSGCTIYINAISPTKLDEALLVSVNLNSFSVETPGGTQHFPYSWVLSFSELAQPSRERRTILSIEVYRQIFTKGAIGIGFSLPI